MITPLHGNFVQGRGDYAGTCSWLDLDRGRAVFAGREGGGELSRANRSRFLPPVAARRGGPGRSPVGGRLGAFAQTSMEGGAERLRFSRRWVERRAPQEIYAVGKVDGLRGRG
jgi:hypothetical protein